MKKHTLSKQTRILFILVFLASLIIVGFGPALYRMAVKDVSSSQENLIQKDYTNSSEVMEKVMKASVPLYLTYIEGVTPKEDIPSISSDLLLWDAEKQSEQERTNFQSNIMLKAKEIELELPELKYYLRSHSDDTKIYTNDSLLENYLNENPVNIDNTYWYIAFSIDENGNLSINMTDTIYSEESLRLTFNEMIEEYTLKSPNVSMKTIKDVDFVFALSPRALKGMDIEATTTTTYTFNEDEGMSLKHYCSSNLIGCYFIILVLFVILVLLLPYETMHKSKLIEAAITKSGACFVFVGVLLTHIVLFTNAATILSMIDSYGFYVSVFLTLLGFIITYLCLALAIFICKKIYFKKKKRTPKENSEVYHILSMLDDSFHTFIRYITTVNFSSLMRKKLVIISSLNALAVLFIIVVFTSVNDIKALILFLIIYMAVVYVLLYRYFKKMKQDHDVLSNVICRLSKGEIHQSVDEDMGMFNTLKESICLLQKDFQNAVEQEVHSQKMKTELVTNVSHDLKTPLTSMISYIDLLKDPALDDKTRIKYIGILENSSERLKHLIENLFDISKANSGSVSLDYMDVDIVSLLQQVESECDVSLKQRHLQLRNQFPKDKVILSLDSQKAYRIFENLISNVSKYSLEKTRVYVNVEDFGSMVEVSIKNVSKNELNFDPEEIMERFTRGDKSRNTEGSGLGLAIAKSFTELLEGSMKIYIDGDLFKVSIRFYRREEES